MGTLRCDNRTILKDVRNPSGVADLLGFTSPNDGNGNLYFWEDGDYSADVDDSNYIASNHVDSTLGAWLSLNIIRNYAEIPFFENLAGLTASASPATTGRQAYIQGLITRRDGGQGYFYFDTSDVSADVDGYLVVAPDGEDGSNGGWVRILDSNLNFIALGGVADNSTDNLAAFNRINNLPTTVSSVYIPPGIYKLTGQATITRSIKITGVKGQTILSDYGLTFQPSETDLTLSSDISEGDTTISVSSVSGVSVFDGIALGSSTAVESQRNRTKRDIATIVDITGTTITLSHATKFAYTTAESGLLVKAVDHTNKVEVDGLSFEFPSLTVSSRPLRFNHLINLRVSNIQITDTDQQKDSGTDGVFIERCLNSYFTNLEFNGLRYGMLLQTCRDIFVRDVISNFCRHAVSPAFFCDGIHVNGLTGNYNTGIMDSHESFNIHYSNVYTATDTLNSNLRSCGGSLRDSVIHSLDTSSAVSMELTMYNQSFTGTQLDEDNVGVVQNCSLTFADSDATIQFQKGARLSVNDLYTNVSTQYAAATSANAIDKVFIKNINSGGVKYRQDITGIYTIDPGVVNATDETTYYSVRPLFEGMLSSSHQKIYGAIFEGVNSDANGDILNTIIRFYDQQLATLKSDGTTARWSVGRLTLLSQRRDTYIRNVYNISHKNVASYSFTFNTTPVMTENNNSGMGITINSTDVVDADDGAVAEDTYIEVDLSLTFTTSNVFKYSLYYELELFSVNT